MIAFSDLGSSEERVAQLSAAGDGLALGRVTSLDRGYPLVTFDGAEARCELATAIKKSDDSIVAVGDWVACRVPESHEFAIIEAVLPRSVEIARVKRVGREGQTRRQVLAANADVVLVCQSLTGAGLDVRLAVRQMAAACGCGATPAFVLTKCDAVEPQVRAQAVAQLHEIAPELQVLCIAAKPGGAGEGAAEVPVKKVSKYAKKKAAAFAQQVVAEGAPDEGAAALASVDDVRALIPHGTTALLLGESGVGKSSLVNALLGEEALATSEVRASDDRGRHTTVARRILQVPGGGLIIDAPGLRTLQIVDLQLTLARTFPDIVSLAGACRFSDCTHTHEPGCAVRDAVNPLRLAAYLQLCDAPASH